MDQRKIVLSYSSIDRCSKRGVFTTIEGARAFAVKWIGKTPEICWSYAVSGDGVGKITVVEGTSLRELYPELTEWMDEGRDKSNGPRLDNRI